MNLVQKVFGTHSERELKLINPIVDKIEALRPKMIALTDEELRDNTRLFKERLAAGETLDDILPEHMQRFERQQDESWIWNTSVYS